MGGTNVNARVRRGQSAVFDAMLFFILILIASGILMVAMPRTSLPIQHIERESEQSTAHTLREALLASTINETYFMNATGKSVFRNYAVDKLLLEDLLARRAYSVPSSNMSVLEGAIKRLADGLIAGSGYKYWLEASIENSNYAIKFSDHEAMPNGRFASGITMTMPDGTGSCRITLYVWK